MTFDDGIIKVYAVKNIADPGEKPRDGLICKSSHYFGYETVGIQRHYTALQAKEKIAEVVHIWRDRDIHGDDVCIIDGCQYRCALVQHASDENGLQITRISLERLGEKYAEFSCSGKG